jgi:hypothetical protein
MLSALEVDKHTMYERMHGSIAEIKEWQAKHEASQSTLDKEHQSLLSYVEDLNEALMGKDLELARTRESVQALEQELEDCRGALAERTEEVMHLKDIELCLKASEDSRSQLTKYYAEKLKSFEDLERQMQEREESLAQQDLQRYLNLTDHLQQQLLEEMDSLKRRVQTVPVYSQSAPLYTPVKGDEVDQRLADFLNAREPPVAVPFRRDEPGVYYFGTKKVFIKIEQGRIIIRVGGGFMRIDEFIDIYTPLELARNTRSTDHPTRERLIHKLISSIDESPDFVTCVGLQRKSAGKGVGRSKSP